MIKPLEYKKTKLQKIISLILLIVIISTIAGGLFSLIYQLINSRPVEAAGYVTANITVGAHTQNAFWVIDDVVHGNYTTDDWNSLCRIDGIDPTFGVMDDIGIIGAGYEWSTRWNNPHKYMLIDRAAIGFNVSAYQSDDIKSVNLWLKCSDNSVTEPGYPMYLTLLGPAWSGTAINATTANAYMPVLPLNLVVGSKRISHIYDGVDYVAGQWYEFKIDTGSWKQHFFNPNADGYIWYTLCCLQDDYGYAPGELVDPTSDYHYPCSQEVFFYARGDSTSSNDYPKLEVTYADKAAPRVMVSDNNSAVYPNPTGDEVATDIAWGTPRCAFADEKLWFMCNGQPGAIVDLKLLKQDGTVLDSVTDSVRTDGNYDWVLSAGTLPADTEAWVRIYEANSKIYSEWGRIEPSPSNTIKSLTVYAVNTTDPQYDYDFSRYAVYKNGLMYVYWNTNVAVNELANYSLEIWPGGDSSNVLFTSTLANLNSGIYKCDSGNYYAAQCRYLVFCPEVSQTGFNNYDGLIINLAVDYLFRNAGFLESVIKANTGAVITWTHSAYFYVQDAVKDGVKLSLDQSDYDSNEVMKLTVTAGEYSKIPSRLPNIKCTIYGDGDADYGSTLGNMNGNTATIDIPKAPNDKGNYVARVFFYNDSVPDYQYIKQISFTVSSGTSGGGGTGTGAYDDIVKMIQDTLKKAHLNSTSGRWLSLIIGMVALFLVFSKSKVLHVIMPSLLFCAACVFGWIDIWYIALIALVDGALIFSKVNKMIHGGGGSGGEDED